MALIEGFGDEVLVFVAIIFVIAIIVFAWASTSVRPMFHNGSVWMIHMQTAPERRVLEVYSLDDSAPAAQQLASNSTDVVDVSFDSAARSDTSLSNSPNSVSNTEESDDSSETQQPRPLENHPCPEQPPRERVITAVEPESVVDTADGFDAPASSSAEATTIKLKFLDDTQKMVATWLSQSVGEFKRQHFENDVSQGKVVRLIYRGQLLRDDSRSLASYGLHDNCVVHCHISATPYEQSSAAIQANRIGDNAGRVGGSPNTGNGLDLGRYVYIIFAFKFAALWSAWFVFPEYFSRTSLVSLMLCSGLFMLFWYGSQRRRPIAAATSTNSGRAS